MKRFAFILNPSQVNSLRLKKDYLMFIKKHLGLLICLFYHKVEILDLDEWVGIKASASVDTDPLTAARESVKKVQ
jgi:hypothetical protein